MEAPILKRRQPQRLIAARQRLVRPVQLLESQRAVDEGVDMVGLGGDRFVAIGERLLEAPQRIERRAAVGEPDRLVRPLRQRGTDQRHRFRVPPLLVREHADQMERVEIVRCGGEHRAIERLGLGKPPGLMQRDGAA